MKFLRGRLRYLIAILVTILSLYMGRELSFFSSHVYSVNLYRYCVVAVLLYMTLCWVFSLFAIYYSPVSKQGSIETTKKKEKSYLLNLELLRVVFTLEVVFCHLSFNIKVWSASYQSVGFFFLLSGFLLIMNFMPEKRILDHIRNSVVRFVPLILLGTCLVGLLNFPIRLGVLISEITFLSYTGICWGSTYNFPSWYVSIFFWVTLFYFGLLKICRRDHLNIFFAIVSFFGLVALNKHGCLGFLGDEGTLAGLISMDLIYGVAVIALGCLAHPLCVELNKRNSCISKKKRIMYTVVEVLVMGYSIAMMHFSAISTTSYAYFTGVMFILIILFVLKIGYLSQFLEKRIWRYFSKYCLSVYLTHILIAKYICSFLYVSHTEVFREHTAMVIIIALLLCIFLGVWAHHVVEKPCARFLRKLFS